MPRIIAKKEDWIKLGYKVFSDKGISGIVIEKMSDKLKVNKSSFYWHFSTKKEFVKQIVSYWISKNTSEIINKVNEERSDTDKFEKLIQLAFKKDSYMDFFFFIKKYAKSNKDLQKQLDIIDKQRIEFTKGLLVQLGIPDGDALIKARLFYKYLIGYHEMIRYKKQEKNYVLEVKKDLHQFINY